MKFYTGFKDKRLMEFKKRLATLRNQKVKIGYFESQGIHSKWGMSYTDLATIHEYGTKKIPPRPVMTITVNGYRYNTGGMKEASKGLIKYLTDLSAPVSMDSALSHIGQSIGDTAYRLYGRTPPLKANHPQTIKQKGYNKPLVWTGEFRANLSYTTTVNSAVRKVK